MLAILARTIRRHGPPDALCLDNGSTYRGQHLSTACVRMGISRMHARPYDAAHRYLGESEKSARSS
jgi:putative transposase